MSIASAGFGTEILVAGYTTGVWSENNIGQTDFVAALLDTGTLASASPTPFQSQSPHLSSFPSVAPTTLSATTNAPTPAMSQSLVPTHFIETTTPTGRGPMQAPMQHPGTPEQIPTSSPTTAADGDGLTLQSTVMVAVLSGVLFSIGVVCALWLHRKSSRIREAAADSGFGELGHVANDPDLHSIAAPSRSMLTRQSHLPRKEESSRSFATEREQSTTQAASLTSLAATPCVPDVQGQRGTTTSHRRGDSCPREVREGGVERNHERQTNQLTATIKVVEQPAIGGAEAVHDIPEVTEGGNVPTGGSRAPTRGLGVAQAVMGAARELTRMSQIPGVADVAGLVIILMNLVMDNSEIAGTGDYMVRRCHSVLLLLQRAVGVLGEVSGHAPGDEERLKHSMTALHSTFIWYACK